MTNASIFKKRLIRLADGLEADAAKEDGIKFDFNNWGAIDNPMNPLSCGTVACAFGYAAISGLFKDEGLDYRTSGRGEVVFTYQGTQWAGAIETAMKLFGLTEQEASHLFTDDRGLDETTGADAERKVAQRIRDFAERRFA